MCEKFQINWVHLACTSFTKLPAGHKLCEFCEEDWLGQWGSTFGKTDDLDRRDVTKSYGNKWVCALLQFSCKFYFSLSFNFGTHNLLISCFALSSSRSIIKQRRSEERRVGKEC